MRTYPGFPARARTLYGARLRIRLDMAQGERLPSDDLRTAHRCCCSSACGWPGIRTLWRDFRPFHVNLRMAARQGHQSLESSEPYDTPQAGGLSDMDHLARFLRATKAPARDAQLQAARPPRRASTCFNQIGCSACHVESLIPALSGTKIHCEALYNANAGQSRCQTIYTQRAIRDQCAYTITHRDPRTSNGTSILTRPSAGRS